MFLKLGNKGLATKFKCRLPMPGVGQIVEQCHACMHMCACVCVCGACVSVKDKALDRCLKGWRIEIEAIDQYSPSSAETIAWISKTKLWHAFYPSNWPLFSSCLLNSLAHFINSKPDLDMFTQTWA